MKPKINLTKRPKRDRWQTPPYALEPLLPWIELERTVWEPAAGEGYLVRELKAKNFEVIDTDIAKGQDFFKINRECDVIITNPPYSLKYPWMNRCLELKRPFALLMPLETLGAAKAQQVFKALGLLLIVLNQRVDFKMPNIGWEKSRSTFPVAWFCCGFGVKEKIVYGNIEK